LFISPPQEISIPLNICEEKLIPEVRHKKNGEKLIPQVRHKKSGEKLIPQVRHKK
jgi:hypothetical protein